MKMFKKLALITLVSTAVFQAQAVSFNDVVQFAQNNPKTTAALALTYAIGVKFNLNRTGYMTQDIIDRSAEWGVPGVIDITTKTYKTHTFMQTLGSYLFPFMYGIVAGN